jgi:hypothetical protein
MAQSSRENKIIGLVDLGEKLPIKLDHLADRLNGLQDEFHFKVLDAITESCMGEPDHKDVFFSIEKLNELLRKHRQRSECTFLAGVTHVRIGCTLSGETQFREDFFSLSDIKSVAVLTINKAVACHRGPVASLEQYLAHLLVCELLILSARKDLCHPLGSGCLFHDCDERSEMCTCIEEAMICSGCRSKLENCNVSKVVIDASMRILRWSKKRQLRIIAQQTLFHPVVTLVFGAFLSVLLYSMAVKIGLWQAGAIVPLAILCVEGYHRWPCDKDHRP